MPSISLDGFSPLKRDENFYLWLALRFAIEKTRDKGKRGHGKGIYFRSNAVMRSVKTAQTPHSVALVRFSMPHAPCPMPHAQCPMPNAPCPMPNANLKLDL
ncbi:hypothetical protein KBT16_20375 [Nostoc sp. CCCryo 231-06]|nr:hypothetical protein [Nostoc sp. CCCryo 231-06]